MSEKPYNGKTNHATYLVNIQINGDYTDELVTESLEKIINDYSDVSELRKSAAESLSVILKEQFTEQKSELQLTGLFIDLMNSIFEEINWYELAEQYVCEKEIYCTRWNTPGCLPDSEPYFCLDFEEARQCIIDELEKYLTDLEQIEKYLEKDKQTENEGLIENVKNGIEFVKKQNDVFGQYIGQYFFCVETV